ncbi:MAG: cytochrome P450, partial [Novosphingobium sp.]|nr:cytochrome P450 [Novosphingobium sp.]
MATTAQTARIPDHVPAENVWDNDFYAFLGELEDPYRSAARLHDGPGIIWATNASHGLPAWIFTQHRLIQEGFGNARRFSSRRGPLTEAVMNPDWMLIPVEADAPEHHYYRDVLRPFFTPEVIEAQTSQIQALTDHLIDGFIERGTCEFVSEFAQIFPNAIVVSTLGLPSESLRQFLDWEEMAIHGKDAAEQLAAGNAIHDYLQAFVQAQQRSGKPASPLMASILAGRMSDRPFSQREIMGIVYLLFIAGLDTVSSSMGWVMRHLAIDQPLQHRLRCNPAEIPKAVDEFMRAFGVSAPSRVVAEDMVFEGVPMKKGDHVLLPTSLAGRDPRAFPDPHVIDIDRRPRHVTFG